MKVLAIILFEDQNTRMSNVFLSDKEKEYLEVKHHTCKQGKERDRIKAILLRSEDWTAPMIAQALRIHESTVNRHINDYIENKKLTIESGGSNSLLSDAQTKELVTHLELNTYKTTIEIASYIKTKYGVAYTVPGLNKWLHRNGFSYKKPKGYPHKADKTKQEEFIETYKTLKNTIEPEENIMFMDSCHPSISTKITYGWIKKGQTKPIETTASRTRINLIGAINLDNLSKLIIGSYSTVDGESIVDFLQQVRLNSDVSGAIHLILDQAGYHRSAYVVEEAKKLNIKLHYLPPYSPNLNPIERLWKVMNEHVRNNKFFKTAKEFRQDITTFFSKTLPKIASRLSSRINDNFQKLDYAF